LNSGFFILNGDVVSHDAHYDAPHGAGYGDEPPGDGEQGGDGFAPSKNSSYR
jgi:hypothetical protein